MASSWGLSWLNSWADHWRTGSGPAPTIRSATVTITSREGVGTITVRSGDATFDGADDR